MYIRDEFSKNRENLDLLVKMRTGGGSTGGAPSAYTPANKLTGLFGLLIIAAAVVPLGVWGGIIPKSAVAGIPLVNELPGMRSSAPASLQAATSTAKGRKHSHKHGRKAAQLKVSHRAVGRVLNAG